MRWLSTQDKHFVRQTQPLLELLLEPTKSEYGAYWNNLWDDPDTAGDRAQNFVIPRALVRQVTLTPHQPSIRSLFQNSTRQNSILDTVYPMYIVKELERELERVLERAKKVLRECWTDAGQTDRDYFPDGAKAWINLSTFMFKCNTTSISKFLTLFCWGVIDVFKLSIISNTNEDYPSPDPVTQ